MYRRVRFLFIAFSFYAHAWGSALNYASLFEHKTILITGGTGFIGRALTTEILKYNPTKVIVFSRDEVKHFKMQVDFKDNRIQNVVGDIRDYNALLDATRDVHIVIHAAALKRLDMLEYNIGECLNTNIIGSMNLVRACIENNVKKVVFISSDKACSPINAYGACKFVSEKIFSNAATEKGKTRFMTVRYGNVVESTGSVMPIFCDKIKKNEEVSLTDPRMTRFFITKEQAVELIFKTLLYGKGGEIFVPCLPAFKIIDLITVLHEKFGKEPSIKITGIRPGEKIHELMINSAEIPRTYKFDGMYVIVSSVDSGKRESLYKTYGQKMNEQTLSEYSSEDAVVNQQELSRLLDEFKINYDAAHRWLD